MAKRMTDTEKWERPWFRQLPANYQRLWGYVLDKCDIAGVWYVDIEMAKFVLNCDLSRQEAENLFSKQLEIKRDRWLVKDFIGFQYGHLTEKNKLFWNVQSKLAQFSTNGAYMGHLSPIYGVKEKEKDIDIKIDRSETEGGVGETKFEYTEDLEEIWAYYLKVMGKDPRILSFSAIRKRKGLARLSEARKKVNNDSEKSKQLMKVAIDTLAASDFHMGRDNKNLGKCYNSWEDNLFRSSEQFENWLERSDK